MSDNKKVTYLEDSAFLRELDNLNNKFYQVRIEVLDKDEKSVEHIEGRVLPGSSINLDGNSSMRRTCSINLVAESEENDLTNVDNLLSINKKIKIFEGIKNDVQSSNPYTDIIQIPLGVFVIVQPSITHNASGCTISLSCKDKMCLLNGECGGNLPTSVTFHEYDQIIGEIDCGGADPETTITDPREYVIYKSGEHFQAQNSTIGQYELNDDSSVGTRVQVKQLFYDIIQTLVCNFGGEDLSRIFINDVPLEIKQLVRWTGNNTLYYNSDTAIYTTDSSYLEEGGSWQAFNYNEDVGYIYTPFTYADMGGGSGELVSNIGDNVCTILDKIKNTLGNFEYFYDIKGNFVFQEIKNYLNNSYDPIITTRNENTPITENGLCILDNLNYKVDFYSTNKSVYTFSEGSGLITAYSNAPSYTNIKNDYHIQGKAQDNFAIHYHVVIKSKPPTDAAGHYPTRPVIQLKDQYGEDTGGLRLAKIDETPDELYEPQDQRAELYIQGLEAQMRQDRPDVYQQELLDLFDSIYNFKEYSFKTDMVKNPNALKYFIDYLEPSQELFDCSVDAVGQKIYSYQKDSIRKLYNMDVPNIILIDMGSSIVDQEKIIDRCELEGQPFSNVDSSIYANIQIGTIGYTAQEVSRELLYQYTNYAESITIQSIPIYYLEPNTRITVYDRKSNIYGDYIIKNISLPLDAGGAMSISATRALERI